MKVLMAASELSPLARTGGLGEAVAGLAGALTDGGHDVTVVIPRYRHLFDYGTPEPGIDPAAAIYRYDTAGLTVLLVDDPESFDREGIYGPRPGEGYEDQWRRFARFSVVVRQLAASYDLLHLHDSHVGPAALESTVPVVLTVHNAAYSILGPLPEVTGILGVEIRHTHPGEALEWYGNANFMKAGLMAADRVTTVSPTFALELASTPDISGGLDGVIRSLAHPVIGIVNGLDPAAWDPATDPALPGRYTAGRPFGRKTSKQALLAEAKLEDGVLFGNVGRMAEQKGLHLLDPYLDALVAEGVRLVLVGNGELDDVVDEWAARHPHAVWHAPYDERLARLVSAGSDFYLMPSRFEPCGIGQMYAMRYGAPPVVRFTGGLADTVIDLDEDPDNATGLGFRLFEEAELAKTIRRAIRVFRRARRDYRRLQRNGMLRDFSWAAAAPVYLEVYGAAMAWRRAGTSGVD